MSSSAGGGASKQPSKSTKSKKKSETTSEKRAEATSKSSQSKAPATPTATATTAAPKTREPLEPNVSNSANEKKKSATSAVLNKAKNRRSGRFTQDYAAIVAHGQVVSEQFDGDDVNANSVSAEAHDAASGAGAAAAATTTAAASGGADGGGADDATASPAKVVRFDKTVDVLVEARKLKKEAKLAKRTKGLSPEEKAQKAKPISERLPQHIGTKITKDHKNFELMFDMLLGIRVSVSLTCGRGPSSTRLPEAAFQGMRDYVFPSQGSSNTPAHKMRDFKFRDYAPKVFRRLRHLFGVDSSDYLISLTGDYVLSEIGSPGKCLARDTPVLMFDGSVKRVQDVERGELLMGDDSTPRRVLGTTTGAMPMARIESQRAPSFTCNAAHVLSLKLAAAAAAADDDDARSLVASFVVAKRVGDGSDVVGSLSEASLSFASECAARSVDAAQARALLRLSDDEAIVSCGDVIDIAVEHVLDRSRVSAALFARLRTFSAGALQFAPRRREGGSAPPIDAYDMGVLVARNGAATRIPDEYKLADVDARLALLAGLLDSGAAADVAGAVRLASKRVADDVLFVARSLGFAARLDAAAAAPLVQLRGELSRIPTRRTTRKAADDDATSEPLVVTPLAECEYFGFALDGNHRFVLGDSFTVTHNSGSFFYYSFDMRFVVKTISHTEVTYFRSILAEYYRHVRDNPHTLLPRFFGMHRVKPHKKDVVYLVVMANVFSNNLELDERYDLKGSTLGRRVPPHKKNKDSVLKDLDFLDNKRRIMLGPLKSKQFLDQLRIDAEFLARVNSMDYSLLIGVHTIDEQKHGPRLALIHLPVPESDVDAAQAAAVASVGLASSSASTTSVSRRSSNNDDDDDDDQHAADEAAAAGRTAPLSRRERRARARAQKKLRAQERKKNLKRKSADKKRLKSENRAAKEAARAAALRAVREGQDPLIAVKPTVAKARPTQAKSILSEDARMRQQSLVRLPGGEDRNSRFVAADGGFQASNTHDEPVGVLYFVGIIDILQPYNFVKWVETRWKSLSNPTATISSVPPDRYCKRFIDFITSVTGSSADDADKLRVIESLDASEHSALDSEASTTSTTSTTDDDEDDDDDDDTDTDDTDDDDDDGSYTSDDDHSVEDTSSVETSSDDDDNDDDSDSMHSAEQ